MQAALGRAYAKAQKTHEANEMSLQSDSTHRPTN